MASLGWININVGRTIKRLKRAAPYPSRKRRRPVGNGAPENPIGPALVRGRGLRRRRPAWLGWLHWVPYVLVSLAVASFVVTRWVLPFLTR